MEFDSETLGRGRVDAAEDGSDGLARIEPGMELVFLGVGKGADHAGARVLFRRWHGGG